MSLKDGKKKMSKSDASDQSRINLKDNQDIIAQKIKKAKTDSLPIPSDKSEFGTRTEAENLINIYQSVSESSLEDILKDFGGKNFSFLKEKLTELLIEKICPIGKEIEKLLKDQKYLKSVLKEGNLKANTIAYSKLNNIYNKIGILNFD